ncbi:M23 family metallopeptidase [Lysobacter sp. A6]|uniref:M23 family metallopeptidase n=1 Tax=Noviluteimonas lactosilytica TaxID=2888523 RepID=A0ABS8JKJ4_9GAMM|nr:M23 family metallopeptidase [Lysobacter lactosilyticus]MCC8364005.1 M23 family metallopeptidase [Lysobacter lactosilyticus]
MRAHVRWLAVACVALACVAMGAHAGKVYRWVDKNGVVHYGDRPPPDAKLEGQQVRVIPVRAEPGAMARLRLEREEGMSLAFADNAIAGPVEVLLKFTKSVNTRGEPELPARATVPANGSVLLARLMPVRAGAGEFGLAMEVVPGDPRATPDDIVYGLPIPREKLRVEQGFNGRFSHTDTQNQYAIDFRAAQGTPVLAARAGTVMQVESDFDKAGLDLEKYGGRANYVRVLHDDGTMALYAHLREEGVLVRVGQRVRTGQRIGLSGNTGFTSGPHLHFAVQVNRGMKLVSIPFRMTGVTDRP